MIPHHQLIPSLNFLTYLKSLVPDILVKHGFLITFIWYYTFCTSSCAQGEPNPQSFINGGRHEKGVNDFLRFFVFRSFIRAFFVENITFTTKQQIRDARLQVEYLKRLEEKEDHDNTRNN